MANFDVLIWWIQQLMLTNRLASVRQKVTFVQYITDVKTVWKLIVQMFLKANIRWVICLFTSHSQSIHAFPPQFTKRKFGFSNLEVMILEEPNVLDVYASLWEEI